MVEDEYCQNVDKNKRNYSKSQIKWHIFNLFKRKVLRFHNNKSYQPTLFIYFVGNAELSTLSVFNEKRYTQSKFLRKKYFWPLATNIQKD